MLWAISCTIVNTLLGFITCYFLLNVVGKAASKQALELRGMTCYFLLNVVVEK